MSSDLQAIQYAGQLIELARGEETASGNPLTAAKHYTTAVEIIVSTAYKHAANMDDLNSRRAFLSQVRNRVEVYCERAELLLQVAVETGLLDKPGQGGGLQAALPGPGVLSCPPPLFGSKDNGRGNGNGQSSDGAPAVMGIPLPPQQPAVGGAGAGAEDDGQSPSTNYYIRPGPSDAAAPPPPSDINLDDLMKQLGAPKEP